MFIHAQQHRKKMQTQFRKRCKLCSDNHWGESIDMLNEDESDNILLGEKTSPPSN